MNSGMACGESLGRKPVGGKEAAVGPAGREATVGVQR